MIHKKGFLSYSKIAFTILCKPVHDIIIILVLSSSFNLEKKKKEKNYKKVLRMNRTN